MAVIRNLAACCCILATFAISFAAEPVGDDDRVTIRVYAPPVNSTAVYDRSQRAVFEEFVRTHPEIRVENTEVLSMQNVGNNSDLLAIAGGIAPDVQSLYYQMMHSYIGQNFLAPVDEYIEKWDKKDIVPEQLWPVVTGEDGKRYGFIYTWPTVFIAYRKDLFEEAGLDPNRGPRDWDELYRFAMKLSRPEAVIETAVDPMAKAGLRGFYLQTSGGWILSDFIWQAGGDVLRRRTDRRWEAVFDSPEAVEALSYWKKLVWAPWTRCQSNQCQGRNVVYEITPEMLAEGVAVCPCCDERTRIDELKRRNRYYVGVTRTGVGGTADLTYYRAFGRGEIAMAIIPLIVFEDVLRENVLRLDSIGIAPLPAGPTGIRAAMLDGDCWCISSGAQNDRRKMDACWEYVKFMTSERAEAIETKVFVESGYARFVRNPHWLAKYGYRAYFDEIDAQQIAAYDEAVDYGRPEPYAPGYSAMVLDMGRAVSRVFRDPDADPARELHEVVQRVNTHIYKLYPEEERRYKQRVAAWLATFFAATLLAVGYYLVKGIARRVASVASGGMSAVLRASRWKHLYAWIFLFPAIATVFLWSYVPLVRGSVMSFYDQKIIENPSNPSVFVGLDNFINAVGQPVFWESLMRTFQYALLTMTFGFFTPIVLALFLAEVPRLKITFRLLFYLPALTSSLVIMFLWKELFFNPSEAGLLNRMLMSLTSDLNHWVNAVLSALHIPWHPNLTIGKQIWLGDPRLAMYCIVLPGIWAGAGPGSIIYLAALKTVPDEMYEAAAMDGAGMLQKIFLVTLPYLKPLILINFLGAFIGSFQATQNIFVMTMGGPEMSTHTLSLEIFFNAFVYLKFGYATAMAWVMGAMLVGFTLYQLRIFQRVQFTAGGSA